MAAKVDALAAKRTRGPYLSLHHRLHRRIAECARCPALLNVIEQTCALSSTWFCLMSRPRAPRTTRRHRELASALVTMTPNRAAEFMREHVRYSEREALERLEPYFRLRRAQGGTFFRSARAQARQLRRRSARARV